MGQGIKRKLDVYESEKTSQNQRQSIVDISVCKLQVNKSVKKVEPSLLRSVLILNTLKHIEYELRKEGHCAPTNTTAMDIPEVNPNSTVIDFLPDQPIHVSNDSNCSPEQFGPLPSIDTFVGNRSVSSEKISMETSPFPVITEPSLTTIYPATLRIDDIFNDLEFNIADYDIFSSVGNNKLTPLSADEVLHSCPNSSLPFGSDSFATLSNASLSPFCKSESAFEDLDNIMQILVGS